jgi:hypothetical protein
MLNLMQKVPIVIYLKLKIQMKSLKHLKSQSLSMKLKSNRIKLKKLKSHNQLMFSPKKSFSSKPNTTRERYSEVTFDDAYINSSLLNKVKEM